MLERETQSRLEESANGGIEDKTRPFKILNLFFSSSPQSEIFAIVDYKLQAICG